MKKKICFLLVLRINLVLDPKLRCIKAAGLLTKLLPSALHSHEGGGVRITFFSPNCVA